MIDIYVLSGTDIGRAFRFEKDTVYIGRSRDNDITLRDNTVSGRHLKVRAENGKLYLTDLETQNGTFLNGAFVSPGIEQEVQEGTPILIGMSLICIGPPCEEYMVSPPDSAQRKKPIGNAESPFTEKRRGTQEKRRAFVHRIDGILMDDDVKRALDKLLGLVFELIKRIDRAVIVISDPETRKPRHVLFKSKRPKEDSKAIYSEEVVDRVLTKGRPVTISNCRVEVEEEIAKTLKIQRIESVMCVPLVGTSKVIGALYVDSLDRPYGFRKEDLSLFYELGRRTAMAIELGWLKPRH